MSKSGEQIYQEREDMILAKLSKEERLIYNLLNLAECIANGDIDAEPWLDDITDAVDFIKAHMEGSKDGK